jgi:hypothetical protein
VYSVAKGVSISKALINPPAGAAAIAAAAATPTTATLATKPAHGSVTIMKNGKFTYTPAAGYVGMDSFTYSISRGGEVSVPVTVTMVVK